VLEGSNINTIYLACREPAELDAGERLAQATLGIFISGKAAFVEPGMPPYVVNRRPLIIERRALVKHLVIKNVLYKPFWHLSGVERLADC